MDHMLGSGSLVRVSPLNWRKKEMNQRRSALAGALREMEPTCSVMSVSRILEVKTLAPVVHLVAWKSLPRKLWNF